jgi:hypothetical protein
MNRWTPALLAMMTVAATTPARLPIVNDDFARARALATARKVPLFVEVWAPW